MVSQLPGMPTKDPRTGHFLPGNRMGGGNPLAGRVAKLRAVILGAVTEEDMLAVTKALVKEAKKGSIHHIAELFNRVIGKPIEADLEDRIRELEQLLDTL